MAEFVGSTVVISLAHPQGGKVRGLIVGVSEGQLKLNQVEWLNTGAIQQWLVVEGQNVLDLDIESETPLPAHPFTSTPTSRNEPTADPAILSYARPSSPGQVSAISQYNAQPNQPRESSHPPVSPVQSLRKVPLEPQSIPRPQPRGLSLEAARNGENVVPMGSEPSANLTEPFNALALNEHVNDRNQDSHTKAHSMRLSAVTNQQIVHSVGNEVPPKTKTKRFRRKNTTSKENKQNGTPQTNSTVQRGQALAPQLTPKTAMGPGWRETPLTEIREAPSTDPQYVEGTLKPQESTRQLQVPGTRNGRASVRSRKRRQAERDDQNGWATGDATDIQDMGDFDFEENHKKFDKKKVFEQIRQDDTTADEARLVNYDRLPPPRPGTYGSKNLHFTENVLDTPTKNVAEHSSDSDSAMASGRSRAMLRTSSIVSRKLPSRKGSAHVDTDGQVAGVGALRDSREDKSYGIGSEALASSNHSLKSYKSSSQRKKPVQLAKPVLRIIASDHRCPYVTPLQMLELEHLAILELDMTEDMITENAATAIAQTARQMAPAPNDQSSRKKHGGRKPLLAPLIVVLVGNHKTGSRAIAAARQLLNHSAQVVLCTLGLEREMGFLDSVRRQLSMFRKRGGRVVEQSQLMDTLKGIYTSTGKRLGRHVTTDLIIDALLGMHLSFEDLRTEQQTAYAQLVQWANTCDVTTISIDIPSGVDSATGATPDPSHVARLKAEASRTGIVLQGDPALVIEAHHVLSLGVPKLGLVLGSSSVPSFQHHHSWLVADIGLDETVWQRSGLRGGQGVEFGSEWVVRVEFVAEP